MTTKNFYQNDERAMILIAKGETIDDNPVYDGDRYRITTWTFRLNGKAGNDWIFSEPVYWSEHRFESREECAKKAAEHELLRDDLIAWIREQLGAKADEGSFDVERNVSEIFTAVQIQNIGPAPEKVRTATLMERLQRSSSMLNAMLCYMI